MSFIKQYVPVVKPLNAIVIGMQGAGKSTCVASLLREPTLLLYSKRQESHSPSNILKGVPLYEGAKVENLFVAAFDVDENGVELSPDDALKKITTVVEEFKASDILNLAFDSLTGVSTTIEESSWFKKIIGASKTHENFAKADAMVFIYKSLITKLQEVNQVNKNLVITLGAMATSVCQVTGEPLSISPFLPYYKVAEQLVFLMDTLLPISTRETQFGRSCFDLRMKTSKSIKDRVTKQLSKHINMHPRLEGVSIADQLMLDELPPDLFYLKEYAKSYAQQAREAQSE